MSTANDTDSDDYDVPDGADAVVCQYCDRPFPTERIRALHWGQAHAAALDADQRERHESASEAESAELRLFRFKALGGLVLVYFTFLLTYALATAEQIGFGAA